MHDRQSVTWEVDPVVLMFLLHNGKFSDYLAVVMNGDDEFPLRGTGRLLPTP